MKQHRGPNTTKGKTPWAEEDKKEQEKEAEGSVEAILDFKKTNQVGAGGYLLRIKWLGYEEKENTWEPMKTLLDGWECEDLYNFFEQVDIDVSKCSDFDFVTRKKKAKKQSNQKNSRKVSVQKDNFNAKTKTKEITREISNVVNSAKKNQVEDEDDFYEDGYICDLSHAPIDGNLKMEDNGSYAANSFLKEKCCKVCNKMFVEKTRKVRKVYTSSVNAHHVIFVATLIAHSTFVVVAT